MTTPQQEARERAMKAANKIGRWWNDEQMAEAILRETGLEELLADRCFAVCAYCGAKITKTPEAITAHIESCGPHPVKKLLTEIESFRTELASAKEELNWQNHRNAGHPTRGGFEFYINEEWTGLANAALDADHGFYAALRKNRIDPDDERVRVRRVAEDDTILRELVAAEKCVEVFKNLAQFVDLPPDCHKAFAEIEKLK
jgi:hypothetical protein